jgi:hypothetical protein
MENIIEVVEAKIKELNSSLDYIRQEEAKTLERKAVIIVKIGALERELEELKGAPKKRVRNKANEVGEKIVIAGNTKGE